LINPEIIKLRKKLHQYPELSGVEFNTAKRIKAFIEKYHPGTLIENIGGTGLAAIYTFSETGTTIMIRCELDALPIEEENHFDYKSKIKGVSHKCGHDGHMAIVAGLIFWIKEQSFTSGQIVLLFQPAEETGQGAAKVIEDERFRNLNPDFVFALHNIPGASLHSIITMKNGFSAEVQSFALYLKGQESHAAEPENGVNPAAGIANIINELTPLNTPELLNDHFSILTPIHIKMGEKSYGVSPGNGEIHYTIRTWNGASMNRLKRNIEKIVERKCITHNLHYEIDWFEYFPASKNDPACNKYIAEVATSNGLRIIEREYPFKFGEDFGWYSKHYKTSMFGLGAGKNAPALHHADYDFPDEIIETGISMFTSLIEKLIQK
jgi:amidohydrolase